MSVWPRYLCCTIIGVWLSVQMGKANAAPVAAAKDQTPSITLPLEGKEVSPTLKTQPSAEDISRDFPKLANYMGMSGRAQVTCDVEADATVDHCVATSEVPIGLGFGAAAIHVASGFHMNPATFDGAPVKGNYTTIIKFVHPGHSPLKPLAAIPPSSDAKLALARELIGLGRYQDLAMRTYEAIVERANQELEWSGRPSETQAAMDAFRQGVQDALDVTIERKAREAAAEMTEADLNTSVSFLKSSAGQSWLTFTYSPGPDDEDFQSRVMDAARERFCAKVQCGPPS